LVDGGASHIATRNFTNPTTWRQRKLFEKKIENPKTTNESVSRDDWTSNVEAFHLPKNRGTVEKQEHIERIRVRVSSDGTMVEP